MKVLSCTLNSSCAQWTLGNRSLTGGDKDVKSSIGGARSRDVQVMTSTFSTGLFYREPWAWIYTTMRRWSSGADVIMLSVALLSDPRADSAGSAEGEGAYRPWRVLETRENASDCGRKMPVCKHTERLRLISNMQAGRCRQLHDEHRQLCFVSDRENSPLDRNRHAGLEA